MEINFFPRWILTKLRVPERSQHHLAILLSTLIVLLVVPIIPHVPHFCLMKKTFGDSLSWLRHFTFGDGGVQIRPRQGVVRKPCWNWRCAAVLLSDRRAASCHCATAGVRSRVVDFEIRFQLLGDTIVPRLDLQSALGRMNGGDFVFQVQHHDGAGRLSHMGDCR